MTPYDEGVRACLSGEDEPKCPYEPGTYEYKEFAEGFCHRIEEIKQGLPDWYD